MPEEAPVLQTLVPNGQPMHGLFPLFCVHGTEARLDIVSAVRYPSFLSLPMSAVDNTMGRLLLIATMCAARCVWLPSEGSEL